MGEQTVYCPCENCEYNNEHKYDDQKAREILAKLTGMTVSNSLDQLTKALIFGKGGTNTTP